MKKYIIIIAAFLLLITSNVILWKWLSNVQEENSRLRINQTILATNASADQKVFTQKEWDKFNFYADSLANSLGIKTKQLNQYYRLYIYYKDLVKVSNTYTPPVPDEEIASQNEPESAQDVRYFQVNKECWSITGVSTKDSTTLNPVFNSNVSSFFYWTWENKTFIKRIFKGFDKNYSSISVLECNNDTLKTLENIQIIKK